MAWYFHPTDFWRRGETSGVRKYGLRHAGVIVDRLFCTDSFVIRTVRILWACWRALVTATTCIANNIESHCRRSANISAKVLAKVFQ